MSRPADHPFRFDLTNELHARPSVPVEPGTRIVHLALLQGEDGRKRERAALTLLCDRFGLDHPPEHATHFILAAPTFTLKWERHTEFTSYTLFTRAGTDADFPPVDRLPLPEDWLARLPGQVICALTLMVVPAPAEKRLPEAWQPFLADGSLCGARVAEGAATIWTDFRLHEDGAARMLLLDHGLEARQAGRLVLRLIEIETYRSLALLALPVARELAPTITDMERALADITAQLSAAEGVEDERRLLAQLTARASGLERLLAQSSYRFSAARAYHGIVEARIDALREERLPAIRTIDGFMDRRLGPAMRTCRTIETRMADLSRRLARAANLLRTRVEVAMEEQNRGLLASMERRARLQLRLQQTVEGLSVIAISYYAVGLVGYVAKAAESLLPLKPATVTGLAAPLVLGLVWLGLQRLKRRLHRDEHG